VSFEKQLSIGKVGESRIARWLMKRGNLVLPVYEIAENQYKGPALYSASASIISPDMVVFNSGKVLWVEAKNKSAFTWHRKTSRFVTGIDKHHYYEYLRVSRQTKTPVWLLFLHGKGTAKDTPKGLTSPSGLFGGEVFSLNRLINHEHENWGKYGMVYWAESSLKKFASIEEVGE
jgi:hypothetical protein